MIVSDLPSDLLEEILSRVPAMRLKRLRSTCKRWNALFKDGGFTKKHFRKAAKRSLVLTLKESSIFLASISLNVALHLLNLRFPLSLNDPHSISKQVGIHNIFHCNGLLLCTTTTDHRIVVWNPCLGETRCIAKPECNKYSWFALGYENNNFCHRYKILSWYQRNNKFGMVEIYEFSSDSWRVLDVKTLDWRTIDPSGVALKGNVYWLAYDKKDKSEFLQCFDFTREQFRRLCVPTFQSPGLIMSISVVREEQLSVLHKSYNNTSKMEIWVTNKIDTEAALWTKFFTVDLHPHSNGFDKVPFRFLIDEEKKVVLSGNVSCETLEITEIAKVYFVANGPNLLLNLERQRIATDQILGLSSNGNCDP